MKKLALYKCFNPVAPTRGATGNNGANGLPAQLFQSTHPHGVRPAYQDLIIPDSEFQSTHPHGVRRTKVFTGQLIQLAFQSTHPHGVRPSEAYRRAYSCEFQSTHPHGVRQTIKRTLDDDRMFQSTHPHGVRQNQGDMTHGYRSFNPRTHTGCDP